MNAWPSIIRKENRVFFFCNKQSLGLTVISDVSSQKMPLVVLTHGNLHMLVGLRLAFIQTVCHPF